MWFHSLFFKCKIVYSGRAVLQSLVLDPFGSNDGGYFPELPEMFGLFSFPALPTTFGIAKDTSALAVPLATPV